MGEKHLDGTPAGVTGYVRDVLRQDWFVEQFGKGGSAGNPEVKVESRGEAGAYQIGFKGNQPLSILRINRGYSKAEPTIVHEIAHYATTISATSPHDGHGVEFARNHIFVAGKVMGESFANGLEASYREAGVPLGD
jgi:putative metallohydrolase (TIGR04338 family)